MERNTEACNRKASSWTPTFSHVVRTSLNSSQAISHDFDIFFTTFSLHVHALLTCIAKLIENKTAYVTNYMILCILPAILAGGIFVTFLDVRRFLSLVSYHHQICKCDRELA